MVRYER